MQLQIRKAVKEDCQAIMKLVNELAVYEKAPDEVTVTMEHFIQSGFGEKPVWEAFVAEWPPLTPPEEGNNHSKELGDDLKEVKISNQSTILSPTFPSPPGRIGGAFPERIGGAVIAFALYYTRYSTWKGQRMYLEDLLVTENMRGHGVGKLLFDKLIEECKVKKYSGLVWQVLDWNEPAINFYKKFEGVKFDGEWVNCSIEF